MRLEAGLHGQEPPQHGDARDDLQGVVHEQAVAQHVDEADDEVVQLERRHVRGERPAERAGEGDDGVRALLDHLRQRVALGELGRHAEAPEHEPGLGEHGQDVRGPARDLEGLGDPRERARGLLRDAADLPRQARLGLLGRQQHVQPARDLAGLDPRPGGDVGGRGGVGDHRGVGVALLEVPVADPAPGDLAGEVVVVRELHALPGVAAVVHPPARPAPGLVHVEHLPVVHRALVAPRRQHERAAHAPPHANELGHGRAAERRVA